MVSVERVAAKGLGFQLRLERWLGFEVWQGKGFGLWVEFRFCYLRAE